MAWWVRCGLKIKGRLGLKVGLETNVKEKKKNNLLGIVQNYETLFKTRVVYDAMA